MERRILDQSEGKQDNVYVNNDGTEAVVETVQDVEPILRENAELRTMAPNPKAHMRMVARVPEVVHNRWMKEWREGYSDRMPFKQFAAIKLNSRDYSKFRTSDTKI